MAPSLRGSTLTLRARASTDSRYRQLPFHCSRRADPATERRRYYTQVPEIVEGYQEAATRNHLWNDWLQRLVIGLTAVTTALAGVAAAVADWRLRIAPIGTSAVGTIAAGIIAYHKYQARTSSPRRKRNASVRWSWSSHPNAHVINHPASPVPEFKPTTLCWTDWRGRASFELECAEHTVREDQAE